MKLPITVIVPAKNEAKNLPDCLESLTWAEKVYVVDSHSTDATPEICARYDVELVQFNYDGGWPKKKNWAMHNLPIKTEWIFIVDADERVTAELRDEIATAIQDDSMDGYYIRWKFIFLGQWMKHSWNHGWMLRLLRKGSGEYEDLGMRGEGGWDNEVHENILVSGKSACLKAMLLHETRQDLSYWIRKQNDFSDWNARRRMDQLQQFKFTMRNLWCSDPLKRRKALKALYLRMPCKPLAMFAYLYLFKRGFLDGRSGFYFCALRSIHEFNIDAKVYEIKSAREQSS